MRRVPAVALLLLVAACESPVGPPPVLDGDWRGSFVYTRFTVRLSQADSRLAGSGTLGPTPESHMAFPSYNAGVIGTCQPPVVALSWRVAKGPSAHFTGRLVTPDRIDGKMTSDLGPAAGPLTLWRKE